MQKACLKTQYVVCNRINFTKKLSKCQYLLKYSGKTPWEPQIWLYFKKMHEFAYKYF